MSPLDGIGNGIPQKNITGVQPKVVAPAGIQPKDTTIANLSTGAAAPVDTAGVQTTEQQFINLVRQRAKQVGCTTPIPEGTNIRTLANLPLPTDLLNSVNKFISSNQADKEEIVANLDTQVNPGSTETTTETGSPAPASTLPSATSMPATPTIPSMNAGTEMPDMDKAQETFSKGYENGEIQQPGANPKEQADNLAKLIDEKKAAKLEVEKGFDHKIKAEGDDCLAEFVKQRKDVIVDEANKDLQTLKQSELGEVYKKFGDPEKDYAKESTTVEKVANLKDFDVASKLITADNGLKINDKDDKVSDLSARLTLANGIEDLCKTEIRRLSAEKGQIKQIKGDNTFASKVAAAQAKIDAVVKKGEEIRAQKAKIAETMDKKKIERQKEIDTIFAKETDPKLSAKIKERIEKRNKDIENIPKEAEVADAQTAIKSGDVEKVKFDSKNIKEASLLTRHIDEMIKLKGEKALALTNADVAINEFESKKAGLDAIKNIPGAKAPQSVKASTNLGDTIGNITQALTALAGLALTFKSMQVASNAGNIGSPGAIGGLNLPSGSSLPDPKKYQVNLAEQMKSQLAAVSNQAQYGTLQAAGFNVGTGSSNTSPTPSSTSSVISALKTTAFKKKAN